MHYYVAATATKTGSSLHFRSHDGDEHSHTSGQQPTDAVHNLFIEIVYTHNYVNTYHLF